MTSINNQALKELKIAILRKVKVLQEIQRSGLVFHRETEEIKKCYREILSGSNNYTEITNTIENINYKRVSLEAQRQPFRKYTDGEKEYKVMQEICRTLDQT